MVEIREREKSRRLDERFIGDPQAAAIRKAIEETGLTQKEIAEKAGISQVTVSRAAGGRASLRTMERILRVLEDAGEGL